MEPHSIVSYILPGIFVFGVILFVLELKNKQ